MANLLLPEPPEPPFVALLVSGGHTMLVETERWGDYIVLGRSRDDAVGESFDKVAKMLGLGYPGGPVIEKAAAQASPQEFKLPRPMLKDASLDMSFSGLKTAVLHEVERLRSAGALDGSRAGLAASFQAAVVEVLVEKSMRACHETGAHKLIVAGGVARNLALRLALDRRAPEEGVKIIFPPLELCTDNAAMIARTALFHYSRGHEDSLEVRAFATGSLRWRKRA